MKRMKLAVAVVLTALGATRALAADMPVKAPPVAPPAPVYSWTGFYVGANGGYGFADPTVGFTPNNLAAVDATSGFAGGTLPPSVSFTTSGGLGGVQAGYNWQFDPRWVAGLETDFDWSDIKGTGTSNFFLNGPASNLQGTSKIASFGTVRARLGWLANNDLLLFGSGGFAYGHVEENTVLNTAPGNALGAAGSAFSCPAGTNCFLGSSARTLMGWTLGAGLEYAFWRNLSLKAEYLFIDLGPGMTVNTVAQATVGGGSPAPAIFVANYSSVTFHVVRAGLNWKFN